MEGARSLGKAGEVWVEVCLRDRGYDILARNVRLGQDEIDIVAFSRPDLLFVEVKTRSSEAYAPAQRAFDGRKQKAQERAAMRWIEQNRPGASGRLMLATVLLPGWGRIPRIRYHLGDRLRRR